MKARHRSAVSVKEKLRQLWLILTLHFHRQHEKFSSQLQLSQKKLPDLSPKSEVKSSEAAAAATVCEAAAAAMKPAEVSRAEEKMTGKNIRRPPMFMSSWGFTVALTRWGWLHFKTCYIEKNVINSRERGQIFTQLWLHTHNLLLGS